MLKFIEWLGTATAVAGSFAVALHWFLPGYALFLIGAGSWLTAGFVTRNKPLIALNMAFLIANIIGGYNAL